MVVRVARIISGDRQQKSVGIKDFSLGNRRCPIIYAVTLKEHPGVTKVGMTLNWGNRRRSYDCWNLSTNAIGEERVFRFFDEFVDLRALESRILASMPFPTRYKQEWFVADIDDVAREIDRVLTNTDLSYEIE